MFKKLFFIAFLVTFFNSYSQNLDPLRTDDYYAQEKWVDSILNSMTVDQKMGQLFMIQAYSNLDSVFFSLSAFTSSKLFIGLSK